MTDFCTSTTALDVVSTSSGGIRRIDHPLISANQFIARPGSNPTITLPVVGTRLPDVDAISSYLGEPAEFFGSELPTREDVARAVGAYCARLPATGLTALTVTVVAGPDVVVTGRGVALVRPEPVRIEVVDTPSPLPGPDAARWHRMAARTTSKGEVDQLERWLHERGFVDAVPAGTAGPPFLGALWYAAGDAAYGSENPEPTSLLTQLEACGAIAKVLRAEGRPANFAESGDVWWISPSYECHPVAAIGPRACPVDGTTARPNFARLP